jgi:hypothetical protein
MQTNTCNFNNYSHFERRVKTSQLYQEPDRANIDNLLKPMMSFLQMYYIYRFNIPFLIQHIESRKIEDIVCNPAQIDNLIDFKNKDVIKSIVFDKYLDEASFLKLQLFRFAIMPLKFVGYMLIVYNIIPKSTSFITEALKIIASLLSPALIHDYILLNLGINYDNKNILFLLSLTILGAIAAGAIGDKFVIPTNDVIYYTLISALALNPLHVQEEILNLLYTLGVCNIPTNSIILMSVKKYFKDIHNQNDRNFSLQFFDQCHASGELDEFLEKRPDYVLK